MKDVIYNYLQDGGTVRLEYVSRVDGEYFGEMSSVIRGLDHLLGIDDAGVAFEVTRFTTKAVAVPWSNIKNVTFE